MSLRGRVLVIAGSDSGGGAGIQADIKTITALGGYAATAITAVTAQDTLGVHGVARMLPAFVAQQMVCVLDDIGADAIKTGMLGDAHSVEIVAAVLAARPRLPLVLDPVMMAKGGHSLLDADAVAAVKRVLLPLAAVLTPNAPEAEILSGMTCRHPDDLVHVAESLLALGVGAVLLKGGHLPGDMVHDVLATDDGTEMFSAPRIDTRHTHGTGCTLASAVAAGLAQNLSLRDSVIRARAYVRAAILAAPGFGAGHGPLDHTVGWLTGE